MLRAHLAAIIGVVSLAVIVAILAVIVYVRYVYLFIYLFISAIRGKNQIKSLVTKLCQSKLQNKNLSTVSKNVYGSKVMLGYIGITRLSLKAYVI